MSRIRRQSDSTSVWGFKTYKRTAYDEEGDSYPMPTT